MRLPRLAPLAALVAVVLLAACSSSSKAGPTTTTLSTTRSSTTLTTGGATTSSTAGPISTTTVPTSTSVAPPTTVPGVRIISLTGPPSPVVCNSPTSVELHWVTQLATSSTLRINGGGVFAKYSNGKHDELVPLTCNGNPQKYQLTAVGANGATVTKALTLTEREST